MEGNKTNIYTKYIFIAHLQRGLLQQKRFQIKHMHTYSHTDTHTDSDTDLSFYPTFSS